VGIRHGRATVTGERTRHEPLGLTAWEGSGEAVIRESGDLPERERTVAFAEGRRAMQHRLTGGLAAVLLLLASCGEPAPSAPSVQSGVGGEPSTAIEYPVTVRTPGGRVTIDERPERIVSLSPTATEMLFAIGAGDQVVAVDDQSDFPQDAPTTDLSGYEPNVEAIASYAPDLVVYATEPGDLGSTLEGIGITALQQPAAQTLRDVHRQIEQLGVVTDHVEDAGELSDGIAEEIDAIVDDAAGATGLSFYHELDDTYYSVTSDTFIGQLYEILGLRNIADRAKGAAGGYPQLSAEYIIAADPDLIFLADTDCCGQSPATVADRPGWGRIEAVEHGNVIGLDDDVASRWGPRVVDLLTVIAGAVEDARGAAAA
jgi:iron complex transport system substrate-binding protein